MVSIPIPAPDNAYLIQNGKYAGKCPSLMMFSNPNFIYWYFKELEKKLSPQSKRNRLHQQLAWLVQQGENRQTVKLCPHCSKKTVKYYSIRSSLSGSSIGASYCYCEDCVKNYRHSGLRFEAFKFSNLANANRPGNGPFFHELRKLYRWAFGLQGRLSKEKAFDFFKN